MRIRGRNRIKRKRMPAILIIAELLLSFILFRFMYSLAVIVYPDEFSIRTMFANLFSIAFPSVMAVFTVDAIIGLASSKPGSWRNAARSSVALVISNAFFDLMVHMGFVVRSLIISNVVTLIIMIIVILILCLPHVRRFYTPPGFQVPPLINWVKFAFCTPLFGAESYKFTYKGDEEGVPEGFKTDLPKEDDPNQGSSRIG